MTAEPNRSKKHVLVVDDDLAMLTLIDWILTEEGYEVKRAESGFAALKIFLRTEWDAVIIDRAMPGMNGEELARTIKVESPQLPLIMITGLVDAITCPELFDGVVAKPFRSVELLTCLERVTTEPVDV